MNDAVRVSSRRSYCFAGEKQKRVGGSYRVPLSPEEPEVEMETREESPCPEEQ